MAVFGEWGAGKSWALQRLRREVGRLSDKGREAGFVDRLTLVEFNAWHYAEADVWSSLVEDVRARLASAMGRPSAENLPALQCRADERRKHVERLKKRLVLRRWSFVTGIVLALLLWATVAALSQERAVAVMVAATGAVVTTIGTLHAYLSQLRDLRAKTADLSAAGREGGDALARVYGRAAAGELVRAEQELSAAESALAAARSSTDPGAAEQEEVMAALGNELAFRDRLGLVTRTRKLFRTLDSAAASNDPKVPQRVLVIIDDLDRCPPEKVVDVLETVHLLFDTSLFTVALAVDTRWLQQALRREYPGLLSDSDSFAADPFDYLEKIIQIPIRLTPLTNEQAGSMLRGLLHERERVHQPERADESTPRPPEEFPAAIDGRHDGRGSVPAVPAEGMEENLGSITVRYPTPDARAERLDLGESEVAALSALAPLAGPTPRTLTRFVNTYRLLRARDAGRADPQLHDQPNHDVPDRAMATALLLAMCTGRRRAAGLLLAALAEIGPDSLLTLSDVMATLKPSTDADRRELSTVREWLRANTTWGRYRAAVLAQYSSDVARFSFARAQ